MAPSIPTTSYYLTPYDLGYGSIVKFDHDFIGRDALEKVAQKPHRKKVTLALDNVDVTHAISTMFEKQDWAKYFDFPSAVYSTLPYGSIEAARQIPIRLVPTFVVSRSGQALGPLVKARRRDDALRKLNSN